MSAINEWFGYYNAVFTYIKETYGEAELEAYFDHLAKEAYSDITPVYREGGLEAVAKRYVDNFKKDGDEHSAEASVLGDKLTIRIRCPAFTHEVKVKHPARCVGGFLCECCKKLNTKILAEAGYSLSVDRREECNCFWEVVKNDR